jgi:hypothetical protein
MNWLAAGQVKSHDSKGYETAFYWETAVDEKVLGVSRGWDGSVFLPRLTEFCKGSLDAC